MSPTVSKALHLLGLIAYMILVIGPPAVTGFTSVGLPAVAHVISAILGVLGIPFIRQMIPIPTAASTKRIALAASRLAVSAILFALVVLVSGCLPGVPVVVDTPANHAQILACESIASTHNDIVFGDYVLAGGVTGLASTAAAVSSSGNTKTDLAIASAITGGVLLAGTALASYSAADFSSSNCASFVGSLPPMAKQPPPPPPTPADAGAAE